MKKIIKIVLLLLAGALVLIQFLRPPRNIAETAPPHDISMVIPAPPDIHAMLRTSCYDCHSSTTRYPWYAEVQPVGWWLNSHIQEGKRQLNFSEFGSYRPRRQYRKLEEIAEMVGEGEMPLPSYTLVHRDAKLTHEQRDKLLAWVHAARDSMKTKFPPDSLERRR
jgi:hypothetical protein